MRSNAWLAGLLCGFSLTALPAAAQAPAANGNGKLAIVGGYLIDGNEGTPISNSVVLIEGERIVHVGTVSDTPIPGDAKVIDANGYTVMPGLNDAHVHLMILGHGVYSEWFTKYDERMREVMPISARELLMAGVTSARDLGAPLEESIWLRNEIDAGRLLGPRLFVSGPFLQKRSSEDQKFFRWLIDGPEDARRKTRQLIDAGVDLIKVIESDRLSIEERRAIRQEAERAGLHIAAHGYTHEELRAAIEDVGARTIEHVNARPHPFYPEESVRLMADNNVYAVPSSIVSIAYHMAEDFPEMIDDQRLARDLPPELYRDVRGSLDHISRLGYFTDKREMSGFHAQKVKQLYDAGVRILVGTDSGTPINFHYESTANEMELLTKYGIPPMKVISGATRLPALVYGKGRELGTVQPGRLADIIVVRGNPLADMGAMRNVVHVVKGGVQYR